VLQERTTSFLAPLVEGCSLHHTTVVQGMLQLGLALYWDTPAEDMSPLAAAILRRLVEAADSGHFASPGSPLAALAAQLADIMLYGRCALKLPVGTSAFCCMLHYCEAGICVCNVVAMCCLLHPWMMRGCPVHDCFQYMCVPSCLQCRPPPEARTWLLQACSD
jgi:hypothetical protein